MAPHHRLARLAASALLAAAACWIAHPAAADAAADVRARLEQWIADFNAGRRDEACDLFSRQLVSDVRGQGEADYARRCELISRALRDGRRTYRYAVRIKEVLPLGDAVVVRLDWALHIAPEDVRTVESGLDIFRKEADGAWRIVRYMAYEN